MRLSFDDEESFKEAVESLCFNNPVSDPNAHQYIRNSSSMPLEESDRNEDDTSTSDPITDRRVGNSSSIQDIRGSGDSRFFR